MQTYPPGAVGADAGTLATIGIAAFLQRRIPNRTEAKTPPSSDGNCTAMPIRPRLTWRLLALTIGPGLVVMLADTEAGSVIVAAQGGALWGYRLVLPQFLLIPALFMAQELAARLGLVTHQGLAELVLKRWGRLPAAIVLATLVASCIVSLRAGPPVAFGA